MTVRSVADVLISFAPRGPVADAGISAVTIEPMHDEAEAAVEAQERAVLAARAEGFAAGLTEAATLHEAEMARERDRFDARLAAAREGWIRDQAEVLADRLEQGLTEIEARIADRTACILRGFLADRLVDRATRELASHIRTLLAGADGKVVAVSGPGDLLTALSEKLAGAAAALDLRPGGSADLRVVCDDTLVESRLSAWLDRLTREVE
jgi:hypothetical protein